MFLFIYTRKVRSKSICLKNLNTVYYVIIKIHRSLSFTGAPLFVNYVKFIITVIFFFTTNVCKNQKHFFFNRIIQYDCETFRRDLKRLVGITREVIRTMDGWHAQTSQTRAVQYSINFINRFSMGLEFQYFFFLLLRLKFPQTFYESSAEWRLFSPVVFDIPDRSIIVRGEGWFLFEAAA